MPIQPGMKIGVYEVVGPLGAGGMGQVFRARDSRLGRDVAIKALPAEVAREGERLARFEREARVLASLQHAHVAAVYGLEDSADGPCLVMELVEGETLAARLQRGPLSLAETVRIGQQVAGALSAAHARDIVHRDLKPANLMVTPDGDAKVLDFGLARAGAPATGAASDLSLSPTVAVAPTAVGVILGTAPYMSPEQARGRTVDARTDIWSLGCILHECLTGRCLFAGETVSDVIARVLEREPDWNALPATTPDDLKSLLARMLAKDVSRRVSSMAEVGAALSAPTSLSASHVSSSRGGEVLELPSLAVLEFANSSGDPDSDYFCSGIAEDILTDLTRLKGLRVASRAAVERVRKRGLEAAAIGAELGVRHLLQGSVRRAGDRLRITVQLVDAQDGFQRWAERYDRTLADVFAVQEEIAAAITEALRVALAPGESVGDAGRNRPGDVRAYDLYLRGRAAYSRYNEADMREALRCFEECTQVDPAYALAWAGQADALGQLCVFADAVGIEETARRGLEAARRALALDPRLPEAYKAEALNLRQLGDRRGAMASLQRALEIDPDFRPAITNLGVQAYERGDLAGAERRFRRAVQLEPDEPFVRAWMALVLIPTRREDEALVEIGRVRRLSDAPIYRAFEGSARIMVALRRGDAAVVADVLREAGPEVDERAREVWGAVLARLRGDHTAAAEHVRRTGHGAGIDAWTQLLRTRLAIELGLTELQGRMFEDPLVDQLAHIFTRIFPELQGARNDAAAVGAELPTVLVWPLEAPMMEARVHACFREVRIESGLPGLSQSKG